MGRPRTPNHLKILAGAREDRINRNEPLPAESAVLPPMALSEGAQKVWDRLAPDLIDKGVLSAWDVDIFAVFCDVAALYHECRALMGSGYVSMGSVKDTWVRSPYWRVMRDCIETMAKIGGRFGLTPADRAGLDVSSDTGPEFGAERILG